MSQTGRPLRFLGGVLLGWTALRCVMLWPQLAEAGSPAAPVSPVVAGRPARTVLLPRAEVLSVPVALVPGAVPRAFLRTAAPPAPAPARPRLPLPAVLAPSQPHPLAAAVLGVGWSLPPTPLAGPLQPPQSSLVPFAPAARAPRRWSADLWLLARPDSPGGGLSAPQLGGSQIGVRLGYALDRRDRIALAGRLSAPLHGRGAEAAVGLEWRPFRAPLRIVADQRIALDGGRSGPELALVAGLPPTRLPLRFSLEAYGQAGAIARRRIEGYADGAAHLLRPIAAIGAARIELGAGAWGGIQPGARRLDIGPSAALVMPVAGHGIRLSLDWRERIAGDARPRSGPALSLGASF